jgi:hypothetical protein
MVVSPHPAAPRGAYAHRHETCGGDAMDAAGAGDARVKRPTKPCGPDTPMLVSSFKGHALFDATVTRTPGTPRRARYKSSNIAQGMPECSVVPVRSRVRSLRYLLHTRLRVQRHPAFPAPSSSRGSHEDARLGRNAPRECEAVLFRHCEERSDDVSAVAQRAKAEAIHTPEVAMDRFAPLAMTVGTATHTPIRPPRLISAPRCRYLARQTNRE